jgi:hypothetical protein
VKSIPGATFLFHVALADVPIFDQFRIASAAQ